MVVKVGLVKGLVVVLWYVMISGFICGFIEVFFKEYNYFGFKEL